MKNLRSLASLAAAIALCLAPSYALAGDSEKVRVDFAKCPANPPIPLPPLTSVVLFIFWLHFYSSAAAEEHACKNSVDLLESSVLI